MVLISSLAVLLGLMLVGLGAATMLQNDFRVTANLRQSMEAFYYSSAGIEWGKREIARAENFPPAPADRSTAFSTGTFAVSFHAPIVVGPLSARVTLRSTGARGDARHLIEAQFTKTYDLADAALALRGNGLHVSLTAPDSVISGADHDATGTRIAGAPPRSAVSTDSEPLWSAVSHALQSHSGILDVSTGTDALRQSEYLPSGFIDPFALELCGSPAAVSHSIPSGGTLTVENQVWGTQGAPQIHCIDGQTDIADLVMVNGNVSGAGILVIRNADLVLSDAFRWDGLVILTGRDISFRTTGTGLKQIFGALVVNETGIPGADRKILDFEGALRIYFSRPALHSTVPLIPSQALVLAHRALPATLVQNYWRADNR